MSRQAVTRWEGEGSVPELETLVALARYYGVSLDRLVRGTEPCASPGPAMGNGQQGTKDSVELVDFLCRAKRACYAGLGAETKPSRPASHDMVHTEGDLVYYDTWLGSIAFAGEEAVWHGEVPAWAMNYAGRVLGEGFSGDFLKDALARVAADLPYRGPELYTKGDWTYHCRVDGTFDWFIGQEEIFHRGLRVYECRFHGGSVRP